MLKLNNTRFARSSSTPIATGVTIAESGIPLALVREGSVSKADVCADSTTQVFGGVAMTLHTPPLFLPMVFSAVISANNTIDIPRQPKNGQIRVVIGGVGLTKVDVAPDATSKFQVLTGSLKFFGNSGNTAYVQMHYEPTVSEARSILGDVAPGGLASAAVGIIARMTEGQASTNYYNASKDWSSALYVKVVAGLFEPAIKADAISGVAVLSTPTSADPFLTLSIKVA